MVVAMETHGTADVHVAVGTPSGPRAVVVAMETCGTADVHYRLLL